MGHVTVDEEGREVSYWPTFGQEESPTIHDPTFPPPVWPSTPDEAPTGNDEMPEPDDDGLDEGRTQ